MHGEDVDNESKRHAIRAACQEAKLDDLVLLANSEGGLLEDKLREAAWPLLLGCTSEDVELLADRKWQSLPEHADEEQVQKDVDRAFVHYPSNETQRSLEHKKTELFDLIIKVLRVNPMLHYSQGYHDIAQVFLLVLGEEAAFTAVTRISLLRIRDYMLSNLRPAIKHLQLVPAILTCTDPELARHVGQVPPNYALSAVLTLFAHDIEEYTDIARLFDFILAHEPVLSIYLFAALIISRRSELLDIPAEEDDMLLFTLSKLPRPLELQPLIDKALEIHKNHPPEKLPGHVWSDISSYSVLKTSRRRLREQSLVEGQELFKKQSRQLDREMLTARVVQQLRKKQRPIVSFGATLVVGLLSYYLRKHGHDRILWSTLWRATELLQGR